MTQTPSTRFTFRTFVLLLVPIILLAGVIALFLSTGGGLNLDSAAPVENLDIERYVLKQGGIELQVRNTGPEELTIAQVIVNDAVMPFEVHPDPVIPRLGRASITIDYPWSYGEAYGLIIFTGNAIPFTVDIPVAFETPRPDNATFWSFTLIGLYVGVIPVFLGIFWFPALRQMGRRTMTFLMAATAGLLVFLGLDTVAGNDINQCIPVVNAPICIRHHESVAVSIECNPDLRPMVTHCGGQRRRTGGTALVIDVVAVRGITDRNDFGSQFMQHMRGNVIGRAVRAIDHDAHSA